MIDSPTPPISCLLKVMPCARGRWRALLTRYTVHRHTSYLFLPAPKFCSLLSLKPASCTHSPPQSFNHLLRRRKGKTSFKYDCRVHVAFDSLTCIQACLNAPEPPSNNENGVDGESTVDSPEDVSHASIPAQRPAMPQNPAPIPNHYAMTPEQQQQMAYQYHMQQQSGVSGQYPMPPQARMPHQQPSA